MKISFRSKDTLSLTKFLDHKNLDLCGIEKALSHRNVKLLIISPLHI